MNSKDENTSNIDNFFSKYLCKDILTIIKEYVENKWYEVCINIRGLSAIECICQLDKDEIKHLWRFNLLKCNRCASENRCVICIGIKVIDITNIARHEKKINEDLVDRLIQCSGYYYSFEKDNHSDYDSDIGEYWK
jgi:hypothetical protein